MNDVEGSAPVGFDSDIKPLFRAHDRDSMRGQFDLWSSNDVRAHGDAILNQLKAGTMPCDGAWPRDRIMLLERWLSQEGDG